MGVLIPLIDKGGVKVANITKKWYFKWWVAVLFIKLILGTKKARCETGLIRFNHL